MTSAETFEMLTKKRRRILAATCFINICIGSLYAWSVFAQPLADQLNRTAGTALTSADLSIVFTAANAVGPITMISGGLLVRRIGIRRLTLIGGLVFGLGLFLCSTATSVSQVIVYYGMFCGLALGLVYGCLTMNAVRFYPDRRGHVGGLTTASYGLSSVLVPPLANALIESHGVSAAFRILGIAVAVLITAASFFLRDCPDDFVPAGFMPAQQTAAAAVDKDWRQMLRDPVFYILMAILMCGAVFGLMIISLASPLAQQMAGMSAAQAAVVVSVLALFNAAGRIGAGSASDRFGRIRTLRFMLVLAAAGLLLLYGVQPGSFVCFYAGIAVIGLCFGAFMGIFPGLVAEQWGSRNSSVNYGILFIGFAIGGYIGPKIMRSVYAAAGSYQKGFLYALLLTAAGYLFCLFYEAISRTRKKGKFS